MKLRILLRSWAILCVSVVFFPASSDAQRLPSMDEEPWFGFFSGHKQRNFEFGVDDEGQCSLFLLGARDKKRVGATRTVKIYTEIHVENDQGKVNAKRLKDEEGFATDMKAGLDHKEVKFTAESTDDAKVEVSVKYERGKIIMDGKILDLGELKGEKFYLVIKVIVPAMYGRTYESADEKKLKSVMKKDRIKFVRAADKKRVTLKSYEEVDLAKDDMAKGGITELEVAMDGQEGNDFTFTTVDGTGVLEFENASRAKTGPLWKGYTVKWKKEFVQPDADAGSKKDARKSSQKPISPLVFECG